jgi:hypothetical protein
MSATISALAAAGEGTIDIQNRIPNVLDARVSDKVTLANLKGPDFVMGMVWGTAATTDATSLKPAVDMKTGNVIAIPFLSANDNVAGYINASPFTFTIKDMPSATDVWVALAAWEISKGSDPFIARDAFGKFGFSGVIKTKAGGPDPDPANPPSTAGNFRGLGTKAQFTVDAIPEPSILGLGLIGAAALMLRRRS